MAWALEYVRRHAIATLALICSLLALAGASYAAFTVPAGSVDERAIRNHAIDPVKFNASSIGGYVRAWASVDADGRVLASGGRPKVTVDRFVAPGHFIVDWRTKPHTRCETIVSVDATGGTPPGFAIAGTVPPRGLRSENSVVVTFNAQAQPAALPFDAALIC